MSPNGMTEVERIVAVESGVKEVQGDIADIRRDIGDIRSQLMGRPTWAVSMIITLLTAACTGLGAAVVALSRL